MKKETVAALLLTLNIAQDAGDRSFDLGGSLLKQLLDLGYIDNINAKRPNEKGTGLLKRWLDNGMKL